METTRSDGLQCKDISKDGKQIEDCKKNEKNVILDDVCGVTTYKTATMVLGIVLLISFVVIVVLSIFVDYYKKLLM